MKQHKPWFDEECSGFLDQKKRAKVRWLQGPSQRNVDNLIDISGTKRRKIRKLKLMNLKLTLRSKISETCIGASITLGRVTSLELI